MFNWAIAGFTVGMGVGIAFTYSVMDEDYQSLQKEFTEYRLEVTKANLKAANELAAKQQQIGDIDAKYTAQVATLQKENDRLSDCLSTGKCGLRFKGGVQTATSTATNRTGDSGVGNGTTCELARESGPAYIALRKGLAQQRAQLLEAQEILKLCQKRNSQ